MISLRLSETDESLIKSYARDRGETVSSFMRRVAFAEIENEYEKLKESCLDPENNNSTAFSK